MTFWFPKFRTLSTSSLAWAALLVAAACCDADQLENVRVRLVNGSSIRGTIEAIDQAGVISGSQNLADAKIEDLTSITTGKSITPNESSVAVLNLRLGGKLLCDTVIAENDSITATAMSGNWNLPTESAESLVWQTSDKVLETIADPSSQFDSVIVSSRKGPVVVKGLVEKIDRDHVYLEYNGKSRKITINKVSAVVFAKLEFEKPKQSLAKTLLVDGSEVTGAIRELKSGNLKIGISQQVVLDIDVEQIVKLEIQSKRIVYLSDLEPAKFEQQAQFVLPRSWQRDKSLLGNPIQLKYASSGRMVDFEKGIGTRSYTSISFSNEGFSHLRTVVGIDAETNGNGDCEMVIEGDGIRLWSKRVTGSSDPEPVVLPIGEFNEIALVVLPGENFDLGDHAVWADAKFTKSK